MKRLLPALLAAGAAIILAISAPAAASAHVTVSPNAASAGSFVLVNVKVPNESATAVTNKVEVALPTDTPFSSVSYVPVTGWTTDLVTSTLPTPVKVGENTIKEAVTTVIWTAAPGFEITAGQLQVFPLSLGPVPDVSTIVLPTTQTYSDGTVVSWDSTKPGAEHPAPTIVVSAAAAGGSDGVGTSAPTTDVLGRMFGIGGLVVGALGLCVAIVALRRKEG